MNKQTETVREGNRLQRVNNQQQLEIIKLLKSDPEAGEVGICEVIYL